MKKKSTTTIAVHDGAFHADDVFAAVILKILYPDAQIVRTRDPEVLSQADFRVDVGGKNDPLTGDFDHHQNEDVGVRENGIPYASVGLVWKHYGERVAGSEKNAAVIDQRLIQQVDANDNGYTLPYDDSEPAPYTVSRVIEAFNPVWDDKTQDYDEAFARASEVALSIFHNELRKARGRAKARQFVMEALEEYADSPYIVLQQAMPWQDYVIDRSDALYVIYPTQNGDWRVRAVPKAKGGFELRKPLPSSWAGLRDEELKETTGVPGAIFCHRQRFLAVAQDREAAESLVISAIDS